MILVGIIIGLYLLAVSLNNIELRRGIGTIFSGGSGDEIPGGDVIMMAFFQVILFMFGVIFPVSILYIFFSKRRLAILKRLAIIILTMIIAYLCINIISKHQIGFQIEPVEIAETEHQYGEPPDSLEADPSWLLVFIVSLAVSLVLVGTGFGTWRFINRQKAPIIQIGEEAARTLDQLQKGGDFKEGVIKCYHEMSRVLEEQQNLKRYQAMTTREFEQFLSKTGFKTMEIQRLTRLFEKVRYGNKQLELNEEQEAVDCLTAIVQASKGVS